MEVKEFTVIRSKWARGRGEGLLLNPEGQRCCLGFLGSACGYEDGAIKNVALPHEILYGNDESINRWPKVLIKFHEGDFGDIDNWSGSSLEDEAAGINDCIIGTDVSYRAASGRTVQVTMESEKHREALLTKLFADSGITVRFIDE